MSYKTIFSIGLDLPSVDGFKTFDMSSDQSLLDADIVIVRQNIEIYKRHAVERHNGKLLLSENLSFSLMEKVNHWSSQIKIAFDAGKTIVVFLPAKDEVFRYTGERTYSGTGRSRSTTNHVAPVSNFDFLPIRLGEIVHGQGRSMKLSDKSEVISSYWKVAS
jgi:hypothetical protein